MAVKALTTMTVEPIEENRTRKGHLQISCVLVLTRRHEEPSHNHWERHVVAGRQVGRFRRRLWRILQCPPVFIILAFTHSHDFDDISFPLHIHMTEPGNHAAAQGVQGSAL